jgi:peptide/nickel transport system ATP-binding protein
MYLGMIVERGATAEVIRNPRHPYTQGLLKAIPSLDTLHDRLSPVPGDIPSPTERPSGCPFHTRCGQLRAGQCDVVEPPEVQLGEGRAVRCWLDAEVSQSAKLEVPA